MGPDLLCQEAILLQPAGIPPEILPCPELQGVHENAHQHLWGAPPTGGCGPRDQALVPRMQGTHGGHEVQALLGHGSAPGGQIHGGSEEQQGQGTGL